MAPALSGKVAVITGAATGIGREIAFHFSRVGASVVIDYVGDSAPAMDIVARIESDGGNAIAVEADVSRLPSVKSLFESATQRFGRLDILVNNAGVEREIPFWEMPEELWNHTIAVDLSGPFFCAQAAAKLLIAQGSGGRIINISSVHEDLPMPTNLAYCTAKGGLRMLMRTAAVELAPYGITVNNIGPGAIDTPLDKATKDDPKKYQALLSEIPLARMGKPEEVAQLATFLASDAAAYVTGSTYFIDGGLMRQSKSL